MAIAIIGAGFSVILGLVLTVMGVDISDGVTMIIGLITMLAGPLLALVSSWILYGFGEMIEKIVDIEDNTSCLEKIFVTRTR